MILSGGLSAQNIIIDNTAGNKSEVRISSGREITVKFDNYFRAGADDSFDLEHYKIFSDKRGSNIIGKYNKRKIKFDDGTQYLFKMDKKNRKVYLSDADKNTVFEGKMIFDENEYYPLQEIEIIKSDLDSEIIESWLALATIERLYDTERKEMLRSFIEGAFFGIAWSVR